MKAIVVTAVEGGNPVGLTCGENCTGWTRIGTDGENGVYLVAGTDEHVAALKKNMTCADAEWDKATTAEFTASVNALQAAQAKPALGKTPTLKTATKAVIGEFDEKQFDADDKTEREKATAVESDPVDMQIVLVQRKFIDRLRAVRDDSKAVDALLVELSERLHKLTSDQTKMAAAVAEVMDVVTKRTLVDELLVDV